MISLSTIGVIGAGQMGNGIAHVSALAGYDVVLTDMAPAALERGMATIEANLNRQLTREAITLDAMKTALRRIYTSTDLGAHAKADMVIEAATEKRDVKEAIFRDVCKVVAPHTLLATNTSSISVTGLASVTDRPERFIGLHFMNPVPVMKLIEVIRGLATDQATYEAALGYTNRLGKTTTNAGDFPAFIVNRILVPMINEAVYTLYEGVGSVQSIDTAMKLGANHPMGPLQLADFIGLDTCLSIMQVLYEGLGDSKYRPCPLLVKYVEAGWLGRKAGKGFYDYASEPPVPTR